MKSTTRKSYEIVMEYYEEKKDFKTLSLFPINSKIYPRFYKRNITSELKLIQVGTILKVTKVDSVVTKVSIVNNLIVKKNYIEIEKKKFHIPICGSGFIIYNDKSEIYLAKNKSQGMLSFIYTIGDLVLQKKNSDVATVPTINDTTLTTIQKAIKAMSQEDKESIRKMVKDIEEVKSVFTCWMENKEFRNVEPIQRQILEIYDKIQQDLDLQLEDSQDCHFMNYSFIKGQLSKKSILKKNYENIDEMLYENALREFKEEMYNKTSDLELNSNNYIDFKHFSFETRDHFESIPLFFRFYLVKCKDVELNVKTLEYQKETSRFYERNHDSNTWLELPKFMREKVVSSIDNLKHIGG